MFVLHVLPFDLARGAQVYARALRDGMDGDGGVHRIVTLFRAEAVLLEPDYALDVERGVFRRLGFDPRVWRKLRQLVRDLDPDMLVAHGSEPLKYANAAAGGRPVVSYRIGASMIRSGPRAWALGRQFRRAARLTSVAVDVLEESVEVFGVPRGRCVRIPNGRDPLVFAPGASRDEPPVLVFVGHFDENKQPSLFISVVAGLRRRGVDLSAWMVGEGELWESNRAAAEDAGVELLGRRSDVPDLLRRASVFQLNSLKEGMPGVLIEAGMSGLPSVTTEVSGAHEVLEHGVTGFVVPQGDTDGLIDAAARLLLDQGLRIRMGRAARKRCIAQYSLDASFDVWTHVLEEVFRER